MSAPALDAAYAKYWHALETGDAPAAVEIARQVRDGGLPVTAVLDLFVAAAQIEVGRRWAAAEWDIAQEHRATGISDEVVAALSLDLTATPNGRRVIVTCADGEWHALPARMLATALRSDGWQVTHLGASVPARHLVQLLHDLGPDVVALSCALPTRLFRAREMIEVVRNAGVPIVVGGRGFGPAGRWGLALGATAWAPDARTGLHTLDLPAFVDPAPPLDPVDDAAAALRHARRAVVDECLYAMRSLGLPDVDAYDEQQWARTDEDLGFLLEFLTAALYVDDPELFTRFLTWTDEVLTARSVPTPTLVASLGLVERAISTVIGPQPRVVDYLAAGRAALG